MLGKPPEYTPQRAAAGECPDPAERRAEAVRGRRAGRRGSPTTPARRSRRRRDDLGSRGDQQRRQIRDRGRAGSHRRRDQHARPSEAGGSRGPQRARSVRRGDPLRRQARTAPDDHPQYRRSLRAGFPRAVVEAIRRQRRASRGFSCSGSCGAPATAPSAREEQIAAFDDLAKWVRQGVRPEGDEVLGDLTNAGLKFTQPLRPGDPGTSGMAGSARRRR